MLNKNPANIRKKDVKQPSFLLISKLHLLQRLAILPVLLI
nr:MAG TPA: hypothetical protein [Caudoviricetes sp.]